MSVIYHFSPAPKACSTVTLSRYIQSYSVVRHAWSISAVHLRSKWSTMPKPGSHTNYQLWRIFGLRLAHCPIWIASNTDVWTLQSRFVVKCLLTFSLLCSFEKHTLHAQHSSHSNPNQGFLLPEPLRSYKFQSYWIIYEQLNLQEHESFKRHLLPVPHITLCSAYFKPYQQ